MLGRDKRHRPGRWNRDQKAEERRADGNDDRIGEVLEIVGAGLNRAEALHRPARSEQDLQRRTVGTGVQDAVGVTIAGTNSRAAKTVVMMRFILNSRFLVISACHSKNRPYSSMTEAISGETS